MICTALGTESTNLSNVDGSSKTQAGEGIVTFLEDNSKEVHKCSTSVTWQEMAIETFQKDTVLRKRGLFVRSL